MMESVTVWAVDLLRDPGTDRRGSLSLAPDAIEFRSDAPGHEVRIPFDRVAKVRRLRASPVLMVFHEGDGVRLRTAFFFVQPPPLEPVLRTRDRPTSVSPFGTGLLSRKRARRQNASYLGLGNQSKRDVVIAWERRVRAAMRDAAR